jgi:hypothetical protein
MRSQFFFGISYWLLVILQGCATLPDRMHDAVDTIDISVQKGFGANLHASVFGVGISFNRTILGIEDGSFYAVKDPIPLSEYFKCIEGICCHPISIIDGLEKCPHIDEYGDSAASPSEVACLIWNTHTNPGAGGEEPWYRDKPYENFKLLGIVPTGIDGARISRPYFTKFTVSASFGWGFKAGCNPGELLDFVLGFFKVDIYEDDEDEKQFHPCDYLDEYILSYIPNAFKLWTVR